MYMYMVCPESIQPCTMKNKDIFEEDTIYKKHCTQDNDSFTVLASGGGRHH